VRRLQTGATAGDRDYLSQIVAERTGLCPQPRSVDATVAELTRLEVAAHRPMLPVKPPLSRATAAAACGPCGSLRRGGPRGSAPRFRQFGAVLRHSLLVSGPEAVQHPSGRMCTGSEVAGYGC
jgi:hypothetical protein